MLSSEFFWSSRPRIEVKESEKIEKYKDLARELKKQWKMKVTVTQIVVGALGILPK